MPTQDSDLLSTKLNRPPVTLDRVDRSRLIERLNHSLQQGSVTLVCAAAGFGKTTLVASWIESLTAGEHPATRAAWLSLDEYDSDLVVFLRYFVAAIRTVFPEACPETLALLHAPHPASQAQLVATLSNEIERLPARAVMVLDDYQTIRGQVVHDFLSTLLRHWPRRLHLVLISRSNPPWPLANLRATGEVTEIRTLDLRFTLEETAAFLERVLAAPVSPSAVTWLDQHLEGWIAGLRLVTLSLRAGSDADAELAHVSGTRREIADYLVDEVISSQPPAILRFLLATSILDRFCVALCECVLGTITTGADPPCDVTACIQWLEGNNLFVIPLGTDRQWYRYHHLFQELLQRRLLAELGPAQVTELHRTAAAWLGKQGLIDEALHHALAIDDLELAAQLMVAGLCDVLNRDDRPTLDRWLRLLPDDFIQGHPWLLMIKALAFHISWQLPIVWKLLAQIEALLDAGGQPARGAGEDAQRLGETHDLPVLRGLIASLRAQEAFGKGQADLAIACSEEALALLPKAWRYARGGTVIYWGLGMRAVGRGDEAQHSLLGEYESMLGIPDAYTLRLLFAACFNAIESGDLEQAKSLAQAMLDRATSSRLLLAAGNAHYLRGVVSYCHNELQTAELHFAELVTKRLSVFTQAARNGMIGMARVHVARGETSAAWSVMELLTQFDLDRLGHEADDARSLRAQLACLLGDTKTAFRWADAYTTPVVGRSLLWLQDPHLAKARILLARGTGADVQSALDILDTMLEIAEGTFSIRSQIDIQALRALALEMQGQATAALDALKRAVKLARPGGFIRVFVDLGPPMQSMLLRLAYQDHTAETVRRILAAFPEVRQKDEIRDTGSQVLIANARLVEPLTNRELEVLIQLRERLSNKEIASLLGLSTLTVKRHTINLYGKLGVNRRWDAVIKAEALGLLPPR